MTREECEAKLMEHLEAMVDLLHEYSPESTYLCASWSKDDRNTHFAINNEYFDNESPARDRPINCYRSNGGEIISISI